MSAEIPLTGIGNDFLVPMMLFELLFAQGLGTASVEQRQLLVAAPFLSTGTAVANTLYPDIGSVAEISGIAGPRSPATRAIAAIFSVNSNARVSYLAVPETTGGSPANADLDITIAGSPTGSGQLKVWIGTELLTFPFGTTDTPTTMAAGLVTAGGAKPNLPVTCGNVAGVLKLTAALKGISQGDGTYGAHRVHVWVTPGVGVTITAEAAALGISPAAAGAEGTTTEAASLATALATVASIDKYYDVINGWDATSLTNLRTHIANKALPANGLLSCGFAGFQGTLSAGIALAVGKNHERLELAVQPNGDDEPIVMAAKLAALAQKYELTRDNFNNYGGADMLIPGCWSAADRPTTQDRNDAIKGGVTLIATNDAGAYISKRCTTRSKDSGGTINDLRALEPHRRSRMDELCTEIKQTVAIRVQGKNFVDDEFLADGITVNPAQVIPDNAVTPNMIKKWIIEILNRYAEAGKITAVEATKSSLLVNRHPTLSGTVQARAQIAIVDIFNQFRMQANEIGGR